MLEPMITPLSDRDSHLTVLADYEAFHRRCAEKTDDDYEMYDSLYNAEFAKDIAKYVVNPYSYDPVDESELLTEIRCFKKWQRVIDSPNYLSAIAKTVAAVEQWMTDNDVTEKPFANFVED